MPTCLPLDGRAARGHLRGPRFFAEVCVFNFVRTAWASKIFRAADSARRLLGGEIVPALGARPTLAALLVALLATRLVARDHDALV